MSYKLKGLAKGLELQYDSLVGDAFPKQPVRIVDDNYFRKRKDDESAEDYSSKAKRQVVMETELHQKVYMSIGKFGTEMLRLNQPFIVVDKKDPTKFDIKGEVPEEWIAQGVKSNNSVKIVIEAA